MSPSRWISMTNVKGFVSKRAKYDGETFAHPDIDLEFAYWIDTLEPNQKQPQLLLDACCLMKDEEKNKIEIIYTGLYKQYEKFVDSLKRQTNENNKV